MTDRPFAVQVTGYHAAHGLLFTIALSPDGLAALMAGKAIAFDLREQGLPRGHVILAAGPDPHAVSSALVNGGAEAVVAREPDDPARLALRCPTCGFTAAMGVPLVANGAPALVCPNDGATLAAPLPPDPQAMARTL